MRRVVVATVLVAFLANLLPAPVAAQMPLIDHWATAEECLSASSAPFYVPRITSQRALAKEEVPLAHPTGGCFKMLVPDRECPPESLQNGVCWRWVRIQQGRLFVYRNTANGAKLVRLSDCDNDVVEERPFGPRSNPLAFDDGAVVRGGNLTGSPQIQEVIHRIVSEDAHHHDDDDDNGGNFFTSKRFLIPAGIATGIAAGLCIWKGCLSRSESTACAIVRINGQGATNTCP